MAMNQASAIKLGVCLVAICLASYFMGPPLYWHFKEGLVIAISNSYASSSSFTCPPCSCDWSSQPPLYIPQVLSNGSFTDCSKHDREVSEDAEKNYAELLSEELKLRETEASENQQRGNKALLDAKKMTSQFQKEADKCSSGMETCEEAREKAETTLLAQKKLTAIWEQRARQRAWKDGAIKTRIQSKGNSQTA